jgi:gliding motility-associated lipoprotein GldD
MNKHVQRALIPIQKRFKDAECTSARMTTWVLIYGAIFMFVLSACRENTPTPKPRGYFNIELPVKKYQAYNGACPFTFDYPAYAQMIPDRDKNAQPCWNNLVFPQFNGRLHLTYRQVHSQKELTKLMEYARELAFKHTIKADAIDQKLVNFPDRKVYGIYYAIDGNAASSVQFFLTDSAKNYFRAALYFNERPQYDSIEPVVNFVKKDIDVMINSFRWKN